MAEQLEVKKVPFHMGMLNCNTITGHLLGVRKRERFFPILAKGCLMFGGMIWLTQLGRFMITSFILIARHMGPSEALNV